jgi:hypothetical protein
MIQIASDLLSRCAAESGRLSPFRGLTPVLEFISAQVFHFASLQPLRSIFSAKPAKLAWMLWATLPI